MSDSKQANYAHVDFSKGNFGVNPTAKVEKGIIALEMSLDFAEMIADHLEEKGFEDCAKILRYWMERTPKAEKEPLPSITVTNTEGRVIAECPGFKESHRPTVTLIPRPGSYYKIIGEHSGEVIGKCTAEAREDVMEQEPGCTFVEISKEEFEAEE